MPAPVADIHVWAVKEDMDGRVIRAFTPVFDGLCPAMTMERDRAFTCPGRGAARK
jgi:hypothetical protein